MKKLLLLFLVVPTFLFADVIKDYKKEYPHLNKFKVESNIHVKLKKMYVHEVKIILKSYTQYCFIAQGKKDFHFQIIEKSGNMWEGMFSRNNKLISLENIMEGGIYTIKIYSFDDNDIWVYWGEY